MRLHSLSELLAGGARASWRDSVAKARHEIFGSIKGMPGEDEWVKPLRGRTRTRWYWPSKYLHMDFSLRHYLAMQLRRLERKKDHASILQLWDTVKLFSDHQEELHNFMKTVEGETLKKSTTLQDAVALLRIISGHSAFPLADSSNADSKNNLDMFSPYIKYALRPLNEKVGSAVTVDLSRERMKLRQMLSNEGLTLRSIGVRNRFVDALYLRRRAYYLVKLSRKKPVSDTIQKYRRHFLTHPDEKDLWPESKGISQHSWPSR
ncbi:hypothetical protein BgAZ_101270 [Babesia gibsoni]|uniref:Uncharacterized protein n=1 Tax=Babesia gibsoni TaxID=33632 RepID=A0AAD8USM9_BABGI|nr:hypothetical protein BgAZ_101270 [Babesia gibsoni]